MEETFDQNQNIRAPLRRPVRPIPQEKQEVKYRIKWWMGGALIIFAVCVDLAELAITWIGVVAVGGILSTIISTVAGFIFWVWYLILGVPAFGNPKQFAVRMITVAGEIIPFFDAIPILSWLWTVGTIITVIMTRSEDEGGTLSKISGALPNTQKKIP